MKKTLAIYYIATAEYKNCFKYFHKTIHTFMPDMDKTVIVLSDGLSEYDNKEYNGVKYKVFRIDHYPWPIVALFKMTQILNHKVDCDYACYFNADLFANKHFDYKSNENFFDYNKLNVSYHSYSKNKDDIYGAAYLKLEDDNPNSLSYIGDIQYEYCQSGFFFGPSNIVFKMCEDITEWIKKDLINYVMPKWFDETYLNKWCFLNIEKCHYNYFMMLAAKLSGASPTVLFDNIIKKKKFDNGFSYYKYQ